MRNLTNWLIGIFGFLLLAISIISGYFINKNIEQNKEALEKSVQSQLNLHSRGEVVFKIQTQTKDSLNLIVTSKEFEKINDRIVYLTEEVQKQNSYSQDLINNDIDRLNLYIAIGIGFLGFLGVFIPIVTNLISTNDLRDGLRDARTNLTTMSGDINTASTNSANAITNSNTALQNSQDALQQSQLVQGLETRIGNIETTTNESIPKVETLVLQNAIGRFFNISPYVVSASMRKDEKEHFIEILETIKSGFEECHKLNKKPSDDHFLKNVIKDFRISIQNGRFITGAFTKNTLESFGKLGLLLVKLENHTSSSDESKQCFKEVAETLQAIIDEIKK